MRTLDLANAPDAFHNVCKHAANIAKEFNLRRTSLPQATDIISNYFDLSRYNLIQVRTRADRRHVTTSANAALRMPKQLGSLVFSALAPLQSKRAAACITTPAALSDVHKL